MKIRYLGHSAFEIVAKEGVIYIDPFLTGNPKAAIKEEEVKRADLILVTHDHPDHLGDAVAIAKRTGATVVSTFELASDLQREGVSTHAINLGSFTKIKGVDVMLVQAFHTSTRGAPAGVLFKVEGRTVYHLGDTALFRDLEVIAELYEPEVVLVPVGGFYTMGPMEAVKAIEYLKPKVAIPMHYGTFPVLAQTADEFISGVEKRVPEVRVIALKPGETLEL